MQMEIPAKDQQALFGMQDQYIKSLEKAYAVSMMKYPAKNLWDSAFCLNCLQEGDALSHAMIRSYLNVRLKQEKETYRPAEIYESFQKLLTEAEGNGWSADHEEKTNRKMLLL